MRIEVFNLRTIQDLAPHEPWSLISIVGHGLDWPPVLTDRLHARLNLRFEDHAPEGGVGLLGEGDADRILDFFQAERPTVGLLAVHCVAGMSRSPAVAAALAVIAGLPAVQWLRNGMLNRQVHRMLLARAATRCLWSPTPCDAAA